MVLIWELKYSYNGNIVNFKSKTKRLQFTCTPSLLRCYAKANRSCAVSAWPHLTWPLPVHRLRADLLLQTEVNATQSQVLNTDYPKLNSGLRDEKPATWPEIWHDKFTILWMIGGACNTHGRHKEFVKELQSETLKERDYLGGTGMDRTILKRIFKN
jgi:hypothetical protein